MRNPQIQPVPETEEPKRTTRRTVLRAMGSAALAAAIGSAFPFRRAFAHEDHGAPADLTIRMGEMYFAVDGVEDGEPFRFTSGASHLMHFVNEGAVDHEVHFGREPSIEHRTYLQNLFGMGGEHAMHGFMGLHLKPGESGTLHVWIPESKRGEWEIGCFIPGHYEAGMKAPFVIE